MGAPKFGFHSWSYYVSIKGYKMFLHLIMVRVAVYSILFLLTTIDMNFDCRFANGGSSLIYGSFGYFAFAIEGSPHLRRCREHY